MYNIMENNITRVAINDRGEKQLIAAFSTFLYPTFEEKSPNSSLLTSLYEAFIKFETKYRIKMTEIQQEDIEEMRRFLRHNLAEFQSLPKVNTYDLINLKKEVSSCINGLVNDKNEFKGWLDTNVKNSANGFKGAILAALDYVIIGQQEKNDRREKNKKNEKFIPVDDKVANSLNLTEKQLKQLIYWLSFYYLRKFKKGQVVRQTQTVMPGEEISADTKKDYLAALNKIIEKCENDGSLDYAVQCQLDSELVDKYIYYKKHKEHYEKLLNDNNPAFSRDSIELKIEECDGHMAQLEEKLIYQIMDKVKRTAMSESRNKSRKIQITEGDIRKMVYSAVKMIKEEIGWEEQAYRDNMLKAIEYYKKCKEKGMSDDEFDELDDVPGEFSVEEIMDFIRKNGLDINHIDAKKITDWSSDSTPQEKPNIEGLEDDDDYRYFPSDEIRRLLKEIGFEDEYYDSKAAVIDAIVNKYSSITEPESRRDYLKKGTEIIKMIKTDTKNND